MSVPNELYERVGLLEAQVRYLSERTGIPLPDFRAMAQSSMPPEVQQMIASGNKIGAIKAYREATGVDLATAKKVIDSYST
jgi:ribosomal protein L7/L12